MFSVRQIFRRFSRGWSPRQSHKATGEHDSFNGAGFALRPPTHPIENFCSFSSFGPTLFCCCCGCFAHLILKAKEEGCQLVEFDVSLTADSVAVLLHDDTLERTTNMNGRIRQTLFKDLQKCNCAAKFHSEDSVDGSTRILPMPTLDEMVEWAKTNRQSQLLIIYI